MRGWAVPLAVLVVVAVGCLGVAGFNSVLGDDNLRRIGEVTALYDAGDVVQLEVERRSGRRTTTSAWEMDDSGEASFAHARPAVRIAGTLDCAEQTCYRVAGDALRVEESHDGGDTYTVAWQIDADAYQYLARTYPDVGDPARHLSSRSVVVHAVAGGYVVFVANGRDGLLFRDAGGVWQRLGSPDSGEGCCFYNEPLSLDAGRWSRERVAWPVVGFVALAILGAAALALRGQRPRRYRRLVLVVPLAAIAGYGAYLGWHFPTVGMFPGFFYGIPLTLVALGVGVVLAFWFVRSGGRATVRRAAAGSSPGHGHRVAG